MGFAREVRRYNFHSYFAEVECEKVGEEIVSREGFEGEVLSERDVVDIDFGVCMGA